jgi:hypothetical protein
LGEGKTVKCNLDEIVMILEVLQGKRKAWSSFHSFKDSKTSISFKWDENSGDKVYISIASYSKMLAYSQIIVLKMLLEHLLKEKIAYATIPFASNKKDDNSGEEWDSSGDQESGEAIVEKDNKEEGRKPVIVEEKVSLEQNKVAQIRATIKSESSKALLLNLSNGSDVWFPKSVIHSEYSTEIEASQSFIVDEWILKKNHVSFTKA